LDTQNGTAPPVRSLTDWVSSVSRHEKLLLAMTALLALAHIAVAILVMAGRVTPVVPYPSEPQLVGLYGHVDDRYWVIVNLVCAVGLAIGAAIQRTTPLVAMWLAVLSFASWLVWGGLLMAWSLETKPPVSLVGPSLILAVVLPLSLATAWAWSDREN
jgi:hypothetical protein